MAQEFERSSKMMDDPVVSEYVTRLAQRIAKNSDAKCPILLRIIDSNEVNAFTLPGGYQYVNRGLILATKSEAELAGVLAYCIAHTALRTGTSQATKGELTQLLSIPTMISTSYTWASIGSYQGLNLAIPLTSLKFSREAVIAADFYGTHPPLAERLKTIHEEMARLLPPRTDETVSSPDFEAMKERLRAWQVQTPETAPERPTLRKPGEQFTNVGRLQPCSPRSDDRDQHL